METPLPKLELQKPEGTTVQVAQALIDYMLRSGLVQPGTRLPSERRLADAFGIGRGSVREALKSLSLLGLIEIRQGDGTYLRRPDSELLPQVIEWGLLLGERKVFDLVEARQEIEKSIARLAAGRRTDEDVAALEEDLARMGAAFDDVEAFVDADVDFHLTLARVTDNSVLADILASIQSLLRVWVGRVIGAGSAYQVSYDEHRRVLEAVRAGDPEAATAAMAAHMEGASGRLRATLGNAHETDTSA